ncbi:MAG: glycosyltransferase family 4 protein, partial [Elusimicrobia bacterium]|nr:glycosyltransferase family 4 protein [Elusimicrobiota bacterium]
MREKIKIAEVITRLDRGGAPEIVEAIFNSLKSFVCERKLITGYTACPDTGAKKLFQDASDIIYIPELKREINLINDLLALIKLYLIFRREKFTIVHTHTAKAGVLGRVAAYLAGVPCIIHQPHGHNFYGYFGILGSKMAIILERFLAGLTDKIIVLTELEKEDFLRLKVCQIEKITVVCNGIVLNKYRLENIDKIAVKRLCGIQPEDNSVGFIGRLEPIKGIEYFISAAKIIAAEIPQVKFLIIGEGELRNNLELRVRRLGLAKKFIFTGWREDIPEILAILDICVLPSLNESLGMILLQAQAAGVPIVATNVGGIPEIVMDGKTAILVPPQDAAKLAAA